jgi:general stress protein 26
VRLVVSHNDNLMLYVSSYASSRKVGEIKKNPHVHAVVAKDLTQMRTSYVQIAASAKIRFDKAARKKCWHPYMSKYYSGIDDPEYVIIEIKPNYIEYWDSEFKESEIYKP